MSSLTVGLCLFSALILAAALGVAVSCLRKKKRNAWEMLSLQLLEHYRLFKEKKTEKVEPVTEEEARNVLASYFNCAGFSMPRIGVSDGVVSLGFDGAVYSVRRPGLGLVYTKDWEYVGYYSPRDMSIYKLRDRPKDTAVTKYPSDAEAVEALARLDRVVKDRITLCYGYDRPNEWMSRLLEYAGHYYSVKRKNQGCEADGWGFLTYSGDFSIYISRDKIN